MTFEPAGRSEVCVVGAGPRGLCVVERICANAELRVRDVVVHLVDPFVDFGGRVWTTAQSPSLLMNTIASQVTVFTDESVACAGPIRPGPSLHEWAKTLPLMEPFDRYPAAVLAEAGDLGPDSYPSRALYGHYLTWALRRICHTAPSGVSIRLHARTVVALNEDVDGALVVWFADGSRVAGLSAVVLAQGHVDMPLGEDERRLSRLAAARGLRYVPPSNPAEVDLGAVVAGERVALRGMGLNFFDYLALLTVDRGGRFERADSGLVYRASGQEPVIYASSRRGVPYHARGENEKGVSGRHEPVFLTSTVIERFRSRAEKGCPAVFRVEVWPLIAREVELVYYTTLLEERDGRCAAEDFSLRCTDADATATVELLKEFGIADDERWDWDLVAYPHAGCRFGSPEEFRGWLLKLLVGDVVQARRGNLSSPLKAALDVLRDIRNEVRLIVDYGGLTGSSYRDELRSWYTPLNAYLSIGPPARRIEEMIALIEAGVVHVVGPGMQVEVGDTAFLVTASTVADSTVAVGTLVEARLPEVDIRRTVDPLIQYLMRTRACRPYRIPDTTGRDYESGGLAVTVSPYHLVDADGRPHPRVFAYGVPTESVHWVTAAGARPGVNSVMLGDADAIARATLSVPVPAGQLPRQPEVGASARNSS
ncbi:FAD/NAD(P)-binding protein [Frankia sp. Cr1]|uniref:FAD/NAD(P)-binding protein n=1 Tax=Frankia sp. Cr1 TaxID=3073931 RepID=UPI002AD51D41|nr:FAD/NAD(P)-binding protein [Frankia sp. Cr1]